MRVWYLRGRTVLADSPRWLRGLILVQAVAVLTAGGVIAGHAKLLVGPDERAHVSYVQIMETQHRLPFQDFDCISYSLHVLQPASPYAPCAQNRGSSYEAFQPPLYYTLAVPVFAIVPGVADKVYALRGLDVVLLAVAMLALAWLAYETLGSSWAYGVALGMCAFAIPAVLVEQTLVSNDALELPLTLLTLAACARGLRVRTRGSLVIASLLVGAVLLTKLTSVYVIVPFAVMVAHRLWARRDRPAWIDTALAIAIPLVMLAPWFALNEKRYHALTANQLAHIQQGPILNPTHQRYTWSQIPGLDRTLAASYLPKLCGVPQPDAPGEPLRDPVAYLLLAVILLAPVLLAYRRQLMRGVFTLAPLGLGILTFDAIHILAQQNLDIARFLHPTLPPFGVGLTLLIAGRELRFVRWSGGLALALFIIAAVFWITTALPDQFVCTQHVLS